MKKSNLSVLAFVVVAIVAISANAQTPVIDTTVAYNETSAQFSILQKAVVDQQQLVTAQKAKVDTAQTEVGIAEAGKVQKQLAAEAIATDIKALQEVMGKAASLEGQAEDLRLKRKSAETEMDAALNTPAYTNKKKVFDDARVLEDAARANLTTAKTEVEALAKTLKAKYSIPDGKDVEAEVRLKLAAALGDVTAADGAIAAAKAKLTAEQNTLAPLSQELDKRVQALRQYAPGAATVGMLRDTVIPRLDSLDRRVENLERQTADPTAAVEAELNALTGNTSISTCEEAKVTVRCLRSLKLKQRNAEQICRLMNLVENVYAQFGYAGCKGYLDRTVAAAKKDASIVVFGDVLYTVKFDPAAKAWVAVKK